MTKDEAKNFLANTKVMVGYKGQEFMDKLNSILGTDDPAPDYPFCYINEDCEPIFGSSPKKFASHPNKELLLSDIFDITIETPMKPFEETDIVCDAEHETFALVGKDLLIEALYYADDDIFICAEECPEVRVDVRTLSDVEYATDEEVVKFYSQAFIHGYILSDTKCSKSFKEGTTYYYLAADFANKKLIVVANRNSDSDLDWLLWKSGNYFLTKESAEQESTYYRLADR